MLKNQIKKILCCGLMLISLLLTSCGFHTVSQGVIIEKFYREAYTIYEPWVVGTSSIIIPINQPEEFIFKVQFDDGSVRDVEVNLKEYESLNEGDIFISE